MFCPLIALLADHLLGRVWFVVLIILAAGTVAVDAAADGAVAVDTIAVVAAAVGAAAVGSVVVCAAEVGGWGAGLVLV